MRTHFKMMCAFVILVAAVFLISRIGFQPARAAGPWYVSTTGNDSNSCMSPMEACATINGAIGKAISGDTVYVATGTYVKNTFSEVVLIDKDITLKGGWDSNFVVQNDFSIIDGQKLMGGIRVDSSVSADVEGFIVENCVGYIGGINNFGLLNLGNSIVRMNESDHHGGGIFNGNELIATNITVLDNSSSQGGGIYNSGDMVLEQGVVSDNKAGDGGGVYNNSAGSLEIKNSVIKNNKSDTDGGGVYNLGDLIFINSKTDFTVGQFTNRG